jgi:hypothetical protein
MIPLTFCFLSLYIFYNVSCPTHAQAAHARVDDAFSTPSPDTMSL